MKVWQRETPRSVLTLVRQILVLWPGANLHPQNPTSMVLSLFNCLMFFMITQMVLATPFQSIPTISGLGTISGQTLFESLGNSTEYRSLQRLHEGNLKFRLQSVTQSKTMIQQGRVLSSFPWMQIIYLAF